MAICHVKISSEQLTCARWPYAEEHDDDEYGAGDNGRELLKDFYYIPDGLEERLHDPPPDGSCHRWYPPGRLGIVELATTDAQRSQYSVLRGFEKQQTLVLNVKWSDLMGSERRMFSVTLMTR
jgi:hypothetical protein